MRQWRPRLEEINREARQYGDGVRGGLEQVALRARVHHEAKDWLILMDCSNTFNTVKRRRSRRRPLACRHSRRFVAKCYGERPPTVFFQTDSGERRKIDCSSRVQQGDAMGLALFCMPLLPVLYQSW